MTNFLLRDPDVVFIHIKKSGGTSVRSLWGDKSGGRAFGHIPADWAQYPAFAIVRHPRARFISAFKMFKFGRGGGDPFYHTPTLPELSVAQALDILEDPAIPYDRSIRTPQGNFKHHILPQTDPFCCLYAASHILRFENLDAEYPDFAADLGLPPTLPHEGGSHRDIESVTFTTQDTARFEQLFAQDYAQLGYETEDSGAYRPVATPPRPGPSVYTEWPAAFSNRTLHIDKGAASLPAPDVDLGLFADKIVAGVPGRTWPGRKPNLVEHFRSLLPEFAGQSYLAFLMGCTIVVIRRAKDPALKEQALALFWRIVAHDPARLYGELNLRWLTSVADTLADHGQTPAAQALGLTGSVLANTIKLAESERKMFHPARPWPPARRVLGGGQLFDGVIAFGIEKGDMVRNMYGRVDELAGLDPLAGPLAQEIARRVSSHDTVVKRMSDLSGAEKPPVISGRRRRLIERVLARLI